MSWVRVRVRITVRVAPFLFFRFSVTPKFVAVFAGSVQIAFNNSFLVQYSVVVMCLSVQYLLIQLVRVWRPSIRTVCLRQAAGKLISVSYTCRHVKQAVL